MKNKILAGLVTGIFLVGMVGIANATVVTYTDRTTWLAGAGGSSDFLVDFNGFTEDTTITTTLDLGPFSVQSDGGRVVDVPPYENSDTIYGNGTPNLGVFVSGYLYDAIFDFYSPIQSLFADFWVPGNSGSPLEMRLLSSSGATIDTLTVGDFGSSFTSFGFVSDIAISQVVLFNAINDGFNVDDIEGGTASVPEPASMFLFGTCLVGLGGLRIRRKKKA